MRPTVGFLKTEAGGGAVVIAAALVALLLANSPWSAAYFDLIHHESSISIGAFSETLSLQAWVRDGLMAVFFFVVGLEIKQEALKGELSSPRKLALPAIAAVGGLVGPALAYLALNVGAGGAPQGWPVGSATDIAFALAALALVGRDLPGSLRLFLLTLAIADDLGAVGLIAALYHQPIHIGPLLGAGAALAGLILLSQWNEAPFLFRMLGFLTLGAFTLTSGVNTSLAGVAAALTVPIGARGREPEPVIKHFMNSLHPYVDYGVLPLYVFTAAGVSFAGVPWRDLTAPAPLGVAAALCVGRPTGVMAATWLCVRAGLARRPTGSTWLELFGVALLSGIGFTLSLFIGALAFGGGGETAHVQLVAGAGVGSLLSAAAGVAVLRLAARRRRALRGG